mmetsp:Transcript_5258/g.20467  ORF Transcript_5258/g.20467 Transcript_5258/m.20467 type:complete len:477 (-) Transcript_5258:69-1499(-)
MPATAHALRDDVLKFQNSLVLAGFLEQAECGRRAMRLDWGQDPFSDVVVVLSSSLFVLQHRHGFVDERETLFEHVRRVPLGELGIHDGERRARKRVRRRPSRRQTQNLVIRQRKRDGTFGGVEAATRPALRRRRVDSWNLVILLFVVHGRLHRRHRRVRFLLRFLRGSHFGVIRRVFFSRLDLRRGLRDGFRRLVRRVPIRRVRRRRRLIFARAAVRRHPTRDEQSRVDVVVALRRLFLVRRRAAARRLLAVRLVRRAFEVDDFPPVRVRPDRVVTVHHPLIPRVRVLLVFDRFRRRRASSRRLRRRRRVSRRRPPPPPPPPRRSSPRPSSRRPSPPRRRPPPRPRRPTNPRSPVRSPRSTSPSPSPPASSPPPPRRSHRSPSAIPSRARRSVPSLAARSSRPAPRPSQPDRTRRASARTARVAPRPSRRSPRRRPPPRASPSCVPRARPRRAPPARRARTPRPSRLRRAPRVPRG